MATPRLMRSLSDQEGHRLDRSAAHPDQAGLMQAPAESDEFRFPGYRSHRSEPVIERRLKTQSGYPELSDLTPPQGRDLQQLIKTQKDLGKSAEIRKNTLGAPSGFAEATCGLPPESNVFYIGSRHPGHMMIFGLALVRSYHGASGLLSAHAELHGAELSMDAFGLKMYRGEIE